MVLQAILQLSRIPRACDRSEFQRFGLFFFFGKLSFIEESRRKWSKINAAKERESLQSPEIQWILSDFLLLLLLF